MNFSGKYGSASSIWYPASGSRSCHGGSLYDVGFGDYWSASPSSVNAYILNFLYNGYVDPSSSHFRASGFAVRCLQE